MSESAAAGGHGHGAARIRGFDGVRGIAVILVVLNHLDLYPSGESVFRVFNGVTGVHAFFVLSGFLITMLLEREFALTASVSFRAFYLRRTLRIVPAYLVLLLLVTALVLLGQPVAQFNALAAAWLYLTNFAPEAWFSQVLAHTWSLAVEEHFYLVWPAVFLVLRRRGPRAPLVLLALLLVVSVASYWFVQYQWHWYVRLKTVFNIEHWTMIAGAHICLGAAGALLLTGQSVSDGARRWFGAHVTALVSVAVLLASAHVREPVFRFYLEGLALAHLIFWVYINQGGGFVKALEFLPLRYVGQISYGVYLYQGFFLGTELLRLPDRQWPPADPHIGLLLLLLVAPLSFHGLEKPMLALRGRLQAWMNSRRPLRPRPH